MNLTIKTTNMEGTPAITDYVGKKLESVLKFVDENDTSARISVEIGKTTNHHRNGDIFRAEANVHVAHGEFRAAHESEDLYAAIDALKDELLAEMRAKKGRREALFKEGAGEIKRIVRGESDEEAA